ncbi:MAG: T9SS type A sorting domain-containing protein [Flavobacteriales bacterium]|nr:T9SS type A sorting domain-containing protein [Flavobacteriales bacterium]
MKTTIFMLLAVAFMSSASSQRLLDQNPIWHYKVIRPVVTLPTIPVHYLYDFEKIELGKDTILNNQNCKMVKNANSYCGFVSPDSMALYEKDDSIMVYFQKVGYFQKFLDFSATIGTSWTLLIPPSPFNPGPLDTVEISVDSVNNISINSATKKQFYVKHKYAHITYNTSYIEDIGYTEEFLPFFNNLICDYTPNSIGLNCFQSDLVGFYNTGNAPNCEYSTVGIQNQKIHDKNALSVFPNPFTDQLTVKSVNSLDTIQLYDAFGREILDVNYEDLSSLRSGTYFVKITSKDQSIVKTVLKL